MRHTAISLLGWYGVLAILVAYLLISFNALTPTSAAYQMLNLTGALGIIVETIGKKDYQPMALNVIWALVALVALIQLFSR